MVDAQSASMQMCSWVESATIATWPTCRSLAKRRGWTAGSYFPKTKTVLRASLAGRPTGNSKFALRAVLIPMHMIAAVVKGSNICFPSSLPLPLSLRVVVKQICGKPGCSLRVRSRGHCYKHDPNGKR